MKKLWFALGGLAVLCVASLSVNVFLLLRESRRAHQVSVLPMPPVLQNAPEAGRQAVPATAAQPTSLATGVAKSADAANDVVKPLFVREVSYYNYDRTINVSFATKGKVDVPKTETDKVKLSPPISDLKLERGYGSDWELKGSFEPERTYQLTICAGIKSSTGEIVRRFSLQRQDSAIAAAGAFFDPGAILSGGSRGWPAWAFESAAWRH